MSESPFLPGTKIQYAWDSTSLGWLKECARKYKYHMIEGWVGKGDNSVHLSFGSWYHEALELYDHLRTGIKDDFGPTIQLDHDDALRKVVRKALNNTWIIPMVESDGSLTDKQPHGWLSDHPKKNRETLIRSIIWYLEQFKDDPAKTITLANGKPAVELSFRFELDFGPKINGWTGKKCPICAGHGLTDIETKCSACGGTGDEYGPQSVNYILSGHLDRLVTFADGTYVMDRKTSTSTLGSYYFDQYAPDNQMSLYTIAAKVIYNTPVKGVIIDAAQIAVGFTSFARGFTYRSDSELEEWLDNTKWWLGQAEGFAEANFWPMNDKSCHKYGGCPFRKICSKSPEVRQKFLETDFVKRQWNPLEAR